MVFNVMTMDQLAVHRAIGALAMRARAGSLCTYAELIEAINVSRTDLTEILTLISETTAQGQPDLTALLVKKETGLPAGGKWAGARGAWLVELGRLGVATIPLRTAEALQQIPAAVGGGDGET